MDKFCILPDHYQLFMDDLSIKKSDTKTARLEQLFGSKTRARLIRLFLENTEKKFFIREITRLLDSQIHAVRRELYNLLDLGLIKVVQSREHSETPKGLREKKFFQVNNDFILYPELRNLVEKANVLVERQMIEAIQQAGNITYMVLTGRFVDNTDISTDILIVGDNINGELVRGVVSGYEEEFEKELRYTVMKPSEFQFRQEITDRFLYDILVNRHIVIVDNLAKMT